MILSSMTITDARKKAVNFSKPVGCDQVVWITKKGDTRITKPEDLNGMIVATQLNSAAETQAQDLEKTKNIKYNKLMSFDTFETAYLAVKNGQADIATSTKWNNIPLFNQQKDIYQVAFSLPIYNYVGIAIRMQDTDLLQMVNNMLDKEMANGELGNLQYKYYGYGMNCGDQGPNLPAGWTAPK
jgi:polar amino acid transport system substrate-binding protein